MAKAKKGAAKARAKAKARTRRRRAAPKEPDHQDRAAPAHRARDRQDDRAEAAAADRGAGEGEGRAAKLALDTKCARERHEAAEGADHRTGRQGRDDTPTTKPELAGPVLELDSKTMNLDGTHFLKIGVSLQLPAASVPDTVKTTENWSSVASQLVLDTFSGRSFAELSNNGLREQLQHQIGNEVCEKTDGKVVTVYFIDFVMQ